MISEIWSDHKTFSIRIHLPRRGRLPKVDLNNRTRLQNHVSHSKQNHHQKSLPQTVQFAQEMRMKNYRLSDRNRRLL